MTERDNTDVLNDKKYNTIELLSEEIYDDGMKVNRVRVADLSEGSPTREKMQTSIALADAELRDNPQWQAPEDDSTDLQIKNPVSAWIYTSPGMLEWRSTLVPSAIALYPMQHPDITHFPDGGEIDEVAQSFFVDSLDSIGIRTRAKIMTAISARHIEDGGKWVSLACGAAVPVIDTLQSSNTSDRMRIELVDIDESALAFAGSLIKAREVDIKHDITLREANLLRSLVASDELVAEIGPESANMVDALGIFEYFNDKTSVKFLKNAYKLVRPGGVLVAANMLNDRPELDFNQRGIGWPKIYPRSIEELHSIVERAGIQPRAVTMTLAEDGVYAVVEIRK